jgi:hypothetical protein
MRDNASYYEENETSHHNIKMASWKSGVITQTLPSEPNPTETFVEGNEEYTYDSTKTFDYDLGSGKNFNDLVLDTIDVATELDTSHILNDISDDRLNELTESSYAEKVKETLKYGDIQRFRKLIGNLIKSIPENIDRAVESSADLIVAFYYADIESAEANVAKRVIVKQINLYLIIPVSFWVALNWWYVWNYTNFTFNFMDILNSAPFSMLYYILEPGFYVLETMNYYMLTMRMDQNLPCWKREWLSMLWRWRPVTFTMFTFGTAAILKTMPVSETAGGMISGDSTIVSSIIFLGTIVAFGYLTVTCMERMVEWNRLFQNAFLLGFMVLLFLLFVILVAGFASSIAVLYYLFFSQMVLLFFELWNCDAKIRQMITDLKATPVSDPDATLSGKPYTFIKQFIFRNFFGLCWVFGLVLPIFVYSIMQISTISNLPMMITLMIFVVLLDTALMYPVFDIVEKIWEYGNKLMEDIQSIKTTEAAVPDPVRAPLPNKNIQTDNSKSWFNELLIFMMYPLLNWM